MAYDAFLWLASVFEATTASSDNYELAFHYFQKAAHARPAEPDPYLDACDCYEPDLDIPPLTALIDFVRQGILHVTHPTLIYKRLARLYELAGNFPEAERCRQKADDLDSLSSGTLPAT
jgi:tetratricopeptide (TPR) repeat protein